MKTLRLNVIVVEPSRYMSQHKKTETGLLLSQSLSFKA